MKVNWVEKVMNSIEVGDDVRVCCGFQVAGGIVEFKSMEEVVLRDGVFRITISSEDITEIKKMAEIFNKGKIPLDCVTPVEEWMP